MKLRLITLLLTFVLTTCTFHSHAIIGGLSKIVLDPTNLIQNLKTATNGIRQYKNTYNQLVEDIKQTALQVEQLANQAKNLKEDPVKVARQMRANFENLQFLLKSAGRDFQTVAALSQQHRTRFGNYSNLESLPDKQHYQHFSSSIQTSYRQTEEAIELLKQAEITETNRKIVGDAIESTEEAEGSLGVQQASAKIAAATFSSLDNLEQIMSKNLEMHATATATEQMERMQAITYKCRMIHGKSSDKCNA